MKKSFLRKIINFICVFAIVAQSLTPYLVLLPQSTYAQEVTPADPTPTIDQTQPTDTATPTPTIEQVIPTEEITPTPTDIPTEEITPTPTEEVTPTDTQPVDNLSPPIDNPSATLTTPSEWTFENVELNKEYVAPQNSGVKLTFTKLPSPTGNIKIEEITLTEDQIKQTGSLSNKAYDITSDMKDGDFSYNLSLPIPESSKGKAVEVKFAEELSSIGTAEKVENTLTKTDTSVSVTNLNHFTIFIVVDDGGSGYSDNGWNVYTSAGYDGDHHWVTFSQTDKVATWTFTGAPGEYAILPSWVIWNDHATNAHYTSSNIAGGFDLTGNQKVPANASVTNTANGTWSGWFPNAGRYSLVSGNTVTLSVEPTTDGNLAADAIAFVGMNDIYVDASWTGYVMGRDLSSGKIFGVNAFATIQEGITAVTAGGTVNVAAGTYTEALNINKNLTLTGAGRDITTIQAPSTLPLYNWNSGYNSMVAIDTATVDISGFKIDGLHKGNGGKQFVGVHFWKSSGSIKDSKITGFRDSTLDGAQDGFGILVNHVWDVNFLQNVDITNNIIDDYQKGGIVVTELNSNAIINNNTVTGQGPTTTGQIAQNGIQMGYGAGGSITNNTVTAHDYTPTSWSASGILLTGTDGVSITSNNVNNNEVGIALSEDETYEYKGANNSNITLNNLTGNQIGIQVEGQIFGNTGNNISGNTFSTNTFDFDNTSINNVDARNNTWSVADQNNLDQIETKINHNCSNSIYVHGVCSGTDDYSTGGMVRYKDIGTATNSGWNINSKSLTPNETPLDVACGGYSKENSVSQNWTAVSGSNIKYQREVTFPSNAISNFEAGSNTYTPFSTFGSATGIEGLWKTRVRAYVDANSSNTYNSGEDVSDWSNECNITFDKTAPTSTHDLGDLISGTVIVTQQIVDDNAKSGKLRIWKLVGGNPDNSQFFAIGDVSVDTNDKVIYTLNTLTNLYGDGEYRAKFTATDQAGNQSVVQKDFVVDNTAPGIPGTPSTTSPTNSPTQTWTWTPAVEAVSGIQTYFYRIAGDTIVGLTSTGSNIASFITSLGQGIYNFFVTAQDNADNTGLESAAGSLTVDTTAPSAPVISSPTDGAYFNSSPILNDWNDVSDLSGIDYYDVKYVRDSDGVEVLRQETVSQRNHSPSVSTGFTLTVRAVDNAGNVGPWSAPIHYVYDATAPTPTSSSAFSLAFHGADPKLIIKYSCGSGTAGVDVYFDEDMDTSINPTATFSEDVSTTLTEVSSVWLNSRLNSTTYDISCVGQETSNIDITISGAKDLAGNIMSNYLLDTIGIDTVNPTVTLVDSDGQTFNIADMPSQTIKVTFNEDISNLPTIGINPPPIDYQSVNNCGDVDAKTFCFDYVIPAVTETTHRIYVSNAQDLAGNTMASDNSHTFNVDTKAPTLSEVTPVTTPTNDTTPNYTFSSTEGGGVTYSGDCVSAYAAANSSNNTLAFNGLPDGVHSNCTITVIDGVGNASTPLNVSSFRVDTVAPTTPSANPAAGDYTSAGVDVTLSSSDIGGSGVLSIYYTLDGSVPNTDDGTFYTGSINITADTTLKAIAYDNARNASDILTAVYGIPPIISGEVFTRVSDNSLIVSWNTDDLSTSRVVYGTSSVSDATVAAAPNGSNYGYSNTTGEFDTSPKVTSHSVSITGLTTNVTYYYRVISHGSPESVGAEQTYTINYIFGVGGGDGLSSCPDCTKAPSGGAAAGGGVLGLATGPFYESVLGAQVEPGLEVGTNGENGEVLGTESASPTIEPFSQDGQNPTANSTSSLFGNNTIMLLVFLFVAGLLYYFYRRFRKK